MTLLFFIIFFFARPTQRVGLLHCSQMDLIGFSLLAFPHAREILLQMLSIDSNRKLDAVQFLEHVRIPRQNLINLVRPMPSWRPFTELFIFSSQWQYCLPNQVSHLEILRLDLLVVCTGNFSFVLFDFFPATKALALSGPPHYRSSGLHTVRQIDHSETQHALIKP